MKLSMSMTDIDGHESTYTTTRCGNMTEMIEAFNAFLAVCGYGLKVQEEDNASK